MKSIGEIIRNSPEFSKIRFYLFAEQVINKFFEYFPEYKEYICSIKLDDKKLFIYVENATAKASIKENQKEIIEKINKSFNQIVIEKITFDV
ncbi:MAG TPA: DciA family protein [Ignavibacteriales bacterium]|nr:DciA family protein [Ignavibacteriales bacterium]HOL80323.1 DciA family protein [Ignavibacteriales bacterium]HOM64602.1 DciA family protein [Ignavibacteriales bacterium]HPD66699.1 DciA family protein [Ignavibacteriales bacterium]HPP32512.1 DciA family protein [Ignavibacteriales bacterium]